MTLTTTSFVEKARKVHGNKYDYSRVEYVNSKIKVKIICPEHGEFEQVISYHLSGNGCAECGGRIKSTTTNFIENSRNIHGDKYDYSRVEYVNNSTYVKIICPEHGKFEQTPNSHLSGSGCPKCSLEQTDSKGVRKCLDFFQKYNIKFEREVRFADCRHKYTLPFDFQICVNGVSAIVEFNGIQHFKEASGYFANSLESIQLRDKIKRDYLKENNIPFLDIHYFQEDQIDDLLWEFVSNLRRSSLKVA